MIRAKQCRRRPWVNAFNQQRLPVRHSTLTAGKATVFFFVVGVIFIPVGISISLHSMDVSELVVDYTECTRYSENETTSEVQCSAVVGNDSSTECTCHVNFTLTSDFHGPVFMYYGLTNFYQNHRQYVKSVNNYQLLGNLNEVDYCEPFDYTNVLVNNETKRLKIVPCGAIANSLFNDELSLYDNARQENVPLLRTGISWPMDKIRRFNNPEAPGGNLSKAFENFASPPSWRKPVYELDTENPTNNGLMNEDLIVWMRLSGLPNFRKLYRRVDHSYQFYTGGLPTGNYILKVNYRYPVESFRGRKMMILSTMSLLGGKNSFLGIAYMVVGSLSILLAVLFCHIHKNYNKGAEVVEPPRRIVSNLV